MVANDNWTLISNKTTENTDKSYVFVSVYSTIFFVKMRGFFLRSAPHNTFDRFRRGGSRPVQVAHSFT